MMAAAAGAEPLVHYKRMAYMGFTQVILHSRTLLGILNRARRTLRDTRPDCLILVDYPSFNLKLAREAYALGIPVYYYISPKVWAWKEGRVPQLRRYVRRIYSILPFEVAYYRDRHGMEVKYVGNPSLNEIDGELARLDETDPRGRRFRERHGLDRHSRLLALVPGSRRSEIERNLPVMTAAARQLDGMTPVIAAAPSIDRAIYSRIAPGVACVHDDTFALIRNALGSMVTSGTGLSMPRRNVSTRATSRRSPERISALRSGKTFTSTGCFSATGITSSVLATAR